MTTPAESPPTFTLQKTPFPSSTRTSPTHTIGRNKLRTVATRSDFRDKIVITVVQQGRLGHWTQTPLLNPSPTPSSLPPSSFGGDDDATLLPNPHLTSTTLLGSAAVPDLDILAQTLATQIASAIQSRDGREERTLVLGTGLDKSLVGDREAYAELVGLVLDVL